MHNLRVSVVYPSGYAPSIASCGILGMYPILDDEFPIKIALRVSGAYTNNGRKQDLPLTHIVFDTAEKAQEFCDKALPCFQNDNEDGYRELVDTMLKSGDMKSVGTFYYRARVN